MPKSISCVPDNNVLEGEIVEKEDVRALYEETERIARDYNDRMDNAMRYFTTIFSALISISIGGRLWWGIHNRVFVVLPVLALVTVFIGLGELRRLNCRYAENRTVNMKARFWLGFHDEVDEDKRYFKKDCYFFPRRYFEPKVDSGEQLVRDMMHRPDFKHIFRNPTWETLKEAFWYGKARYLSYVTILFMAYMVISIIVACMVWSPEFFAWLIN